MARQNLGEIIRNIALLGFAVLVVGPCAYNMIAHPSADEVLVDSARSAVGGDFADGWIVASANGHGRAVCGVKSSARFVFREGASTPTWETGGEMQRGAVDNWCAQSSRVKALRPGGRL